jgi:PAS domain S-box-containing protein
LVVYATEKNYFGAQELGLLEEAAGDVAFALDGHELAAQRKQGEEALQMEKTFTRALLDNLVEGVVACNEKGDLALFNRTFAKWLGMDAFKLPHDQWAEHYDLFEADGTTPMATHSNPLVRAFNGEQINDVGMVICAKNQPPRHVLCNGSPILDEMNRRLGAVVVMHDITLKRKNEELLLITIQRLELATTSASMGVWDWDLQVGTMTWDDRMFELYGASHGEIQGTVQDWKDGLHPEDLDRAIAECEAAIRGEAPFNTKFRVKHRNGTVLWIKANAVVLRDQQGKPVRMIGLNQDITEQHNVQEEFRGLSRDLEKRVEERTAQLEYANKEMEAFSYSVSHDLRAPLQTIKGFSEILLEEYCGQLDDNGKRYLHRIRASTQRMGDLITDLLKLSKTSHSELTLADCDLSRLCSEIANGLTMANSSCRVEIAIQPGIMVQADHHLMRVVLENLLGNAWKFTSKRQDPKIEVGETVSTSGERAFFVRDNGAGFDMAHADKLFNAFQRLHSASDFEGTGIGLAIVQRIIHRHGGRIWTEARPGEGATFFFTLPD